MIRMILNILSTRFLELRIHNRKMSTDLLGESVEGQGGKPNRLPLLETNYPFFHLELDDAVRSVERAVAK